MTDTASPGAGLADPPDYDRMDAYYYSFTSTGVVEIDRILSAVAWAGKAYHNTSQWQDEAYDSGTPVEWIQKAANDAAKLRTQPPADSGAVGEFCHWLRTYYGDDLEARTLLIQAARLIETLVRERDDWEKHARTKRDTLKKINREATDFRLQLTTAQRALSESKAREKELREVLRVCWDFFNGTTPNGDRRFNKEFNECLDAVNALTTPSPGEET